MHPHSNKVVRDMLSFMHILTSQQFSIIYRDMAVKTSRASCHSSRLAHGCVNKILKSICCAVACSA